MGGERGVGGVIKTLFVNYVYLLTAHLASGAAMFTVIISMEVKRSLLSRSFYF